MTPEERADVITDNVRAFLDFLQRRHGITLLDCDLRVSFRDKRFTGRFVLDIKDKREDLPK